MDSDPLIAQFGARLRDFTGARRYQHSLNVCQAARELARRFAPQLETPAAVAGLLHDNAKRLTDAELMNACRDYDIQLTPVESAMPTLAHGKVGAALLESRFGVKDAEVAQAIADHVTGRPGMGLLSRLLYVADQSAADRDFAGVETLRRLAQTDLEGSVLLVAACKIQAVVARGWLLEPGSLGLYNEQLLKGLTLVQA